MILLEDKEILACYDYNVIVKHVTKIKVLKQHNRRVMSVHYKSGLKKISIRNNAPREVRQHKKESLTPFLPLPRLVRTTLCNMQ